MSTDPLGVKKPRVSHERLVDQYGYPYNWHGTNKDMSMLVSFMNYVFTSIMYCYDYYFLLSIVMLLGDTSAISQIAQREVHGQLMGDLSKLKKKQNTAVLDESTLMTKIYSGKNFAQDFAQDRHHNQDRDQSYI